MEYLLFVISFPTYVACDHYRPDFTWHTVHCACVLSFLWISAKYILSCLRLFLFLCQPYTSLTPLCKLKQKKWAALSLRKHQVAPDACALASRHSRRSPCRRRSRPGDLSNWRAHGAGVYDHRALNSSASNCGTGAVDISVLISSIDELNINVIKAVMPTARRSLAFLIIHKIKPV